MTHPLYDTIGAGYARARRPDPRLAPTVWQALGDARSMVNIGAGTGNDEPTDHAVVAVEPARAMLDQRHARQPPAVQAVAEAVPFPDGMFDATLATFTLHHWRDLTAGLQELRRVAQRQVILMNEPTIGQQFWHITSFPEARRMPVERRAPCVADVQCIRAVRSVTPLLIPSDCTDGFIGA